MSRYAVTLWYVVAAVLAPKVCCCALHAADAPPRIATATEARTKTCPHCRTTETPADTKPADKPTCPCQKGHSQLAPAVVTAPASQWLDAPSGPSVIGFIDQLPVPAFAASLFVALPRTGPPLTADDLLRAFHFLRC